MSTIKMIDQARSRMTVRQRNSAIALAMFEAARRELRSIA